MRAEGNTLMPVARDYAHTIVGLRADIEAVRGTVELTRKALRETRERNAALTNTMLAAIAEALNGAQWTDVIWWGPEDSPIHQTLVERIAEVTGLVFGYDGQVMVSTHGATQLELKAGAKDG